MGEEWGGKNAIRDFKAKEHLSSTHVEEHFSRDSRLVSADNYFPILPAYPGSSY